MKTISTTAIVALMTASIGLSAAAPAFAQTTAPAQNQQQAQMQGKGFGMREHFQHGQGQRPGGFGDFLGFERGAEAVEIALVRLSHNIELTAEQQPLFDAFKTAALDAAQTLEDKMETLRPAAPAQGQQAAIPDFSERFDNRIEMEKARLAALEAVQPSATAFFDSLTDEQKSALMPRGPNGGGKGQQGGPGMFGPRHQQGMPQSDG